MKDNSVRVLGNEMPDPVKDILGEESGCESQMLLLIRRLMQICNRYSQSRGPFYARFKGNCSYQI